MQILNYDQIERKVKRLTLSILEWHFQEEELFIGGINNNGRRVADMLIDQLRTQSNIAIHPFHITLSPAAPLSQGIDYDLDPNLLADKPILIVDDVANTGRTLYYACKPLMTVTPKSVKMAVLVDRTHKKFPIKVDFVGLSLATTLREDIRIRFEKNIEDSEAILL